MLFKTIDVPAEILQAQKEGKLVIFAGAGVSMGPPANLPSFGGLVQKIGTGASPQRQGETDDQYLGRLHEDGRGMQVHDIAARILLDRDSKPTELHSLLLRLFYPKRPIRLVTTNFDSHFSTAAEQLGIHRIQTFCAPALPLGDDFEGLVYLHGSAAIAANKTVLTDRDFGRAYLTYGWASRFLYQLFSRYTVLFVGYSHSDVVMQYLNRGLPPQTDVRRFAFSPVDTDNSWKAYGIRPLLYEKLPTTNPHSAITESIAEWVEEFHRGLLARSERIRSIVEAIPPLEGEDADYLKYSLLEVDTARQFTKFARLPAYLEWLERYGFLKNLFDPRAVLSPVEQELILWIASYMLAEHPQQLLALVQRHGQILHPEFCWRIYWRLAYRRGEPSVDAIFHTWVSILLSQPHTNLSREDFACLLAECRWPGDKECAVLLFEFLTRPRLTLKQNWDFLVKLSGEESNELVDYEVDLSSETEHWLSEHLKSFFKPHMWEMIGSLEPIVSAHIQSAHSLLLLNKKANDRYDALSIGRQQIARSDRLFYAIFDVLVDAARDVVEVLVTKAAPDGKSLIDRWFNSGVPILRRLAVHGTGVSPTLPPDDKIRWILDRSLLFQTGFKPEAFELLRQAYPSAGAKVREQLINAVLLGRQGMEAEELSERTKEYEIYNLLTWLTQADPNCELARKALESVSRKHSDFKPREHPNLNVVFSSWKDTSQTKFHFDEILAEPPGKYIDQLFATPVETILGEGREGYVHALMGLIATSPDWGLGLQGQLIERGISNEDIWAQVFNGWREAKMTADQWNNWFDAIDTLPSIDLTSAHGIAEVLYSKAARKEAAIPVELMDRGYTLSKRVWACLEKEDASETPGDNDWVNLAINRAAGKVALFWPEYLSVLRGRDGDQWKGIPLSIQADLIKVITGKSASAGLAQVMIASYFHYFFYLDRKFTRTNLLSLFDWSADELRAERSWHGFLAWGRWQKSYLDEMLPFYAQTVLHLNQLPPRFRESFSTHIAGIAVFGKTDALADGWLQSLLHEFDPQMRRHFADALCTILENMEPDVATNLWNRWLRRYWDERILGRPVPLDQDELCQMARWPVRLGKVMRDAVDLLMKSPKMRLQYPLTDKEIGKLEAVCETFPDSVADYLIIVLRGLNHLYDKKAVLQIVASLETANVDSKKLTSIRDELLRLH